MNQEKCMHLHIYKPPSDRPAQLNFLELEKGLEDPLNDVYNTRYMPA